MFDDVDITDLLGDLSVPTLVAYCAGDSVAPPVEGNYLLHGYRVRRLSPYNSRNYMVFEKGLEYRRLINRIPEFLEAGEVPGKASSADD
jgi:hypothetical protein